MTALRRIIASALVVVCIVVATVEPASAQRLSFLRDAEIEQTLRRMTTPILRAAGIAEETVDLYLVNDRALNAFVAGGRNIFLYSGLLTRFDRPEELVGVIAHEVGHIADGDLARRAIATRNARGPALVGLLAGVLAGAAGGGEAGAAVALGAQQAIRRTLLRFSRSAEGAADQAAVRFMQRAGVDPSGLLTVLEVFRGQEVFNVGNIDPYAVTHPLSTQRVQRLQRRIEEVGAVQNRLPDDIDYWHQRMRAKLEAYLTNPERVLDRLEGASDDEITLYKRAIALQRMPRPDEAIAAVDRLIAMRPSDPFYHELRGDILLDTRKTDAAVSSYRKAVQLAPGQPLLLASLGRALLQFDTASADAEALQVLVEARRTDRSDPAGLRDLAQAYSRTGDDAMASLATAERHALVGNVNDATLFARRAADMLPTGSPAWLRAQDILALE